jgi:hypothetical protein
MKTLRQVPTPLQRYMKQQLLQQYSNFLFDADGLTVYAEGEDGWQCITTNFQLEK